MKFSRYRFKLFFIVSLYCARTFCAAAFGGAGSFCWWKHELARNSEFLRCSLSALLPALDPEGLSFFSYFSTIKCQILLTLRNVCMCLHRVFEFRQRDSLVGMSASLRTGLSGVRIAARARDCPSKWSIPVLGITQPPVRRIPGFFPRG